MVFSGPRGVLSPASFALPQLQAGELLVKISLCTLCGSDLHTFEGRRPTPTPTILGHEILGHVAKLPTGGEVCDVSGRPLKLGDRITWAVAASCKSCFFCRQGLPQKCDSLFKYGHQAITDEHSLSGGLADYCHLASGTAVVLVPDELPDVVAAPASCATATVAAALRYAGDCRDRIVLIQGAGMLGLTAAAMAQDCGASAVIVTDVDAKRLVTARDFGANHEVCVKSGPGELRTLIGQLTDDRGVDVALEMSGSADATESAIELLRIGGRLILVGAVFPGPPVSFNAETIVRKMLSIQGIHNYAPEDLVEALGFLSRSSDEYDFGNLVSSPFALSEAAAAFRHAAESRTLRVAVRPDGDPE